VKKILIVLMTVTLLSACGAAHHRSVVTDDSQDQLTVGKVQKEIRTGMTSAEVASVLGSPNIVSTDAKSREVWIYDKISTTRVRSKSGSYGTLLLLGGQRKSSASQTTQRTLTIIIKYDKSHKVRKIDYHSSSF